ncbi:sugar ABC transporter permease [Hypericibacter terrae]|uniref:Sugar ABC transporter permease n=1 Tax=Hypericibacter terrae TaxID=2602015 RepID=A0A5J6MKI2_9PROT|nr:ABC transporter permease [Hypericibacter terrae]QEX18008.1 sugar ABC transporter permease [Hypericibacter terrae]
MNEDGRAGPSRTGDSLPPAASAAGAGAASPRPGWSRIAAAVFRYREAGIVIAGLLLVAYFQSSSAAFLSLANIENLIQFTATTAIIAAGLVLVLVCGELDLSVGMVYALAPFVMYFAGGAGAPAWLAVIAGLAAAALVGAANGVVTTLLRLPSFVTTLGMLFLINGFTLTISGGYPVQPQAGALFIRIFGGNAWVELAWAVAIALGLQFVLHKTRWGLHTVATGGNPTGAAEVGIKLKVVKTGNFILCSALAGFAGILDAFRIGSIDPLAGGSEIMFAAIASAVIGGTLLTGGLGTVVGAFLGALVLAILKDGFTLLGVSAFTFDMILGAAILVTMAVNIHLSRLRD